MPKIDTKKVTGTKTKSTAKAKPKATDVAKKAKATRPKAKPTTKKAGETALNRKEPETVTIRLPAGARRVENPELPDILKGVPGLEVKASFVFDTPVSLSAGGNRPLGDAMHAGTKGSLGWVLANAHSKVNGEYAVNDGQIAMLKKALRPLLEKVLEANGGSALDNAKISLPDRWRDSESTLMAERQAAGLPSHSNGNYFPVHIEMPDGRIWETAVHPNDLNGIGAEKLTPSQAAREISTAITAGRADKATLTRLLDGFSPNERLGIARDVVETVGNSNGSSSSDLRNLAKRLNEFGSFVLQGRDTSYFPSTHHSYWMDAGDNLERKANVLDGRDPDDGVSGT